LQNAAVEPILRVRRFIMKRLSIVALIGAVLIGCAASPPTQEPGREDMVRVFSVSLEELYEASVAACKDLRAQIVSSEIDEDGGKLEARRSTGGWTYIVIVFMVEDDNSVKMMVFPGSGKQGILMASTKKSDYDEFWAAFERRL
jgi:hypothetical protein